MVYKVTIQNVNQFYFSLQNHLGKRISLSRLDSRVFKGLSLDEANHYTKYIPLGLSVIIDKDEDVIDTEFTLVEDISYDAPLEYVDDLVDDIEDVNYKYSIDELSELKKADLRELCDKEGINFRGLTKAELIDLLVVIHG